MSVVFLVGTNPLGGSRDSFEWGAGRSVPSCYRKGREVGWFHRVMSALGGDFAGGVHGRLSHADGKPAAQVF